MPSLLWIEDQPGYVSAAGDEMQDRGWSVTFKCDIVTAAHELSTVRHDALILDLMVAGNNDGVMQGFAIWSTYRLLCWLRGARPDAMAGVEKLWTPLDGMSPLEHNRVVPAMILSAYHEPEITAAMGAVNRRLLGIEIPCFTKPLDADRIVAEIMSIVAPRKAP